MSEEYNSVLSTPIEADNIGRFGRHRYIGKTQISADKSAMPIYRSISSYHHQICNAVMMITGVIETSAKMSFVSFSMAVIFIIVLLHTLKLQQLVQFGDTSFLELVRSDVHSNAYN